MSELKPCPFCGGKAAISWSGLGYRIRHSHEENPECPIAKYSVDGAEMGVWIYDTRAEAIEAWNRRVSE